MLIVCLLFDPFGKELRKERVVIEKIWVGVALFALATGLLVALSRRSILHPSGYGWFRFMAFESIFLLLFHNTPFWFDDPLSVRQMFSWVLLLLSLWLAWHSFRMLHRFGSPQSSIEETRHLVVRGAFRLIRHPLYTSLALFSCGVLLKRPDAVGAALSLGTFAFLMAASHREESLNLVKFGDSYRSYMRETKRFLPFIF
jgi:protein-S-isoprenylcysteine O-methyltransferase Ste14